MKPANRSTSADDAVEDRLLDGRVRLLQPRNGYRVAIDPVLLAASLLPAGGDRVVDLGCGAGAVSLCLLARCPDLRVTGIERDPAMADLARRNAALNGAAGHFTVLTADIAEPGTGPGDGVCDIVAMNPPYLPAGRADPPPDPGRAAAHVEDGAGLAAWIDAGLRLLARGGLLAVVHRADRLGELLALLEGRAGAMVVHPLWPKAGRPAKRVLVHARKGRRSPLTLTAGSVLHEADGRYTAAIAHALAGGALAMLDRD